MKGMINKMQYLALNNRKEAIPIKNEKELKKYAIYQNNDKLAYVFASDIAFLIKFKGAISKTTIDKMLNIDFKTYQVSTENKKKVKSLVYEKLNHQFNIYPIELDVTTYDDSSFIKAYKLNMDEFIE